ncbi:hypothetical protein [Bacteroides acidifaciens]|uniref:hypothetical protein n=1 Tax=Bacteroides acidifaciens TaxID=85831 RepID=UPI003F6941F4
MEANQTVTKNHFLHSDDGNRHEDDFQKPDGKNFQGSGYAEYYPSYRNRKQDFFARHHQHLQGLVRLIRHGEQSECYEKLKTPMNAAFHRSFTIWIPIWFLQFFG